MSDLAHQESPDARYDIVICGGGIAGLWLLNVLVQAGFNTFLIEKEALGGIQTIASQGMIHGGQRYMLGPDSSSHVESTSALPTRWDACLSGQGELDLRAVRILSDTQVMWPAGGTLAQLALATATQLIKTRMRKLNTEEIPAALSALSGVPVYELPEKVLDVESLVAALVNPHCDRIGMGRIDALTSDGSLTVGGVNVKAQLVVCTAGLGNEELMSLINVGGGSTQRRPLRQLMVKPMPFPLYGHGVTTNYRPRVTITSHPLPTGDYVWYLGGAIADDTFYLTEDDAIKFAKQEMKVLFSNVDWIGKQWSTWYGIRAEAFSKLGRLPNGPVVQEYGNILVAWPTKLTLAPLLGDIILDRLAKKVALQKFSSRAAPPLKLALPPLASYPWERANWK